ncbi:hypothetical protein GCM10022419_069370 [Nonomuraea rosea]|uniref:Uncharacterized protein n=1 Tax=Nonomuraea rosea TaxID=638574 RepID=A0ABP6Y6F8_9ACTN
MRTRRCTDRSWRRRSASTQAVREACLRTFVSDSCSTRCSVVITSGARVRSSSPCPISNATFGPSAENLSVSIRRSASVVPGLRAASSSVRNTVTMRRIEVSASDPAAAIASSAGATASGLVSATVRAAWAWTTMPVM